MPRPVSPAVYRRRPIAVGVAALVLVLIVWLLVKAVTGGSRGSADPAPDPSPSASESASPEPAEQAGTADAALASAPEPCAPESLRVVPSVASDQAAGTDVKVLLAVSTDSELPCTMTPEIGLLLRISAEGGDAVFDSAACPDPMLADQVQVSPRWATITTVTWNGRVSGGDCSAGQVPVNAGNYTIQAGTPGGEPGAGTFAIAAAPPPPAPEPEPEPAPEPEAPATEPGAEPPVGTDQPTDPPAEQPAG